MQIDVNRSLTVGELVKLAAGLAEEFGQEARSEYDRALVELIVDAAGLPMDGGREAVTKAIGDEALTDRARLGRGAHGTGC